jgi:hypothetical protein
VLQDAARPRRHNANAELFLREIASKPLHRMNNRVKPLGIAQRTMSSKTKLVCECDRSGSTQGRHINFMFTTELPST